MSHYGDYIKEREGKEILEVPEGFATYSFLEDGCYIEDIYVTPAFRRNGAGAKMADEIAEIAKAKGYKILYGSVKLATNGCTDSLRALLAYGFELRSCGAGYIMLRKEI